MTNNTKNSTKEEPSIDDYLEIATQHAESFGLKRTETILFSCEKCKTTSKTIEWGGVPQYIECGFCYAQYVLWKKDKKLVYDFVRFVKPVKSTSTVIDNDGTTDDFKDDHKFKKKYKYDNTARSYAVSMSSQKRDAFTLLGLKIKSSKKQIKKRYHKLAFKYHPDKHVDLSDKKIKNNEETLKKIIEAYELLMEM